MPRPETLRKGAGWLIHLMVAGLMIFAGSMKVLNMIPPEAVAEMKNSGIGDKLLLLGWGELITAVLLLVPITSSLGVLLTSGFWGGVICFHMVKGDSYVAGSVFLALTWLGAALRNPLTFSSFFVRRRSEKLVSEPVA